MCERTRQKNAQIPKICAFTASGILKSSVKVNGALTKHYSGMSSWVETVVGGRNSDCDKVTDT